MINIAYIERNDPAKQEEERRNLPRGGEPSGEEEFIFARIPHFHNQISRAPSAEIRRHVRRNEKPTSNLVTAPRKAERPRRDGITLFSLFSLLSRRLVGRFWRGGTPRVHLHATSGRLDDVAGVAIERNDILVRLRRPFSLSCLVVSRWPLTDLRN